MVYADSVVLLGCNAVWTRRYTPKFQTNFSPEDVRGIFLLNVGVYLRLHAAQQPRTSLWRHRHRSEEVKSDKLINAVNENTNTVYSGNRKKPMGSAGKLQDYWMLKQMMCTLLLRFQAFRAQPGHFVRHTERVSTGRLIHAKPPELVLKRF
jgi:hypothetical protein